LLGLSALGDSRIAGFEPGNDMILRLSMEIA
jgi:hypothetical protein